MTQSITSEVTSGLDTQLSSRYPVLAETRLLKPVAQTTVPARTTPFNTEKFYQTGSGLYVNETFADRLDLRAKQVVKSAPERPYVSSLLKTNDYDREIRNELPEKHLSTLEDIAGIIVAQSGGKSGFLLINGHVNIFHVEGKNDEVFLVDVYWNSGYQQWDLREWLFKEDSSWLAGIYVICPGTMKL